MLWARTQGVSATILRLGQVYGSGDPYTKVIPTFCQAVSGGLAPVVHGSGDEIRQPVHIRDVVAAVRAWLRKPPGTTSEILLIAGMEQITIRDLARLVMSWQTSRVILEPRQQMLRTYRDIIVLISGEQKRSLDGVLESPSETACRRS